MPYFIPARFSATLSRINPLFIDKPKPKRFYIFIDKGIIGFFPLKQMADPGPILTFNQLTANEIQLIHREDVIQKADIQQSTMANPVIAVAVTFNQPVMEIT